MAKKTLTATYEGITFKRTTDRAYTNVVIGFKKNDPSAPWQALSWASSPTLANKAARQFDRFYTMLIIDVDKQKEVA
jgi:hypothetical protein